MEFWYAMKAHCLLRGRVERTSAGQVYDRFSGAEFLLLNWRRANMASSLGWPLQNFTDHLLVIHVGKCVMINIKNIGHFILDLPFGNICWFVHTHVGLLHCIISLHVIWGVIILRRYDITDPIACTLEKKRAVSRTLLHPWRKNQNNVTH